MKVRAFVSGLSAVVTLAGLTLFLVVAGAGAVAAQQAPAPNAPPATVGDKTYRIYADVVTSAPRRASRVAA